jgi:hypothetical protein
LVRRIYRLPRDLDRDRVRRSFDRAGLSEPERERLYERPRSLDDRLLPERLRLLKKTIIFNLKSIKYKIILLTCHHVLMNYHYPFV